MIICCHGSLFLSFQTAATLINELDYALFLSGSSLFAKVPFSGVKKKGLTNMPSHFGVAHAFVTGSKRTDQQTKLNAFINRNYKKKSVKKSLKMLSQLHGTKIVRNCKKTYKL